jgi:peptidoglycan/LPS O-acetylase OafA/YrhL
LQATQPVRSQKHYAVLDGFRGLAILLVFVFHLGNSRNLNSLWERRIETITSGGWLGVDMFFALSGFLISGILVDSLNDERYFKNFYIRRALRIFPLFYGVLLALALLTPLLHLQWQWGHLSYLVYVQNIAAFFNPSLNAVPPGINLEHFWSLAVEEQFYLIWPFVIWKIRDLRKLTQLSLILIAGGLVLRFILLAFSHTNSVYVWIYKSLPTHADGLLIGAIAAFMIRQKSVAAFYEQTRWIFYAAALCLVAILVTQGPYYGAFAMASLGYTIVAIVFVGILLRALVPNTLTARFFNLGFLRLCGKYSYGIYVYHILFGEFLVHYMYSLQARLHSRLLGGLAYIALHFVGSFLIAVLSYHLFESRFLKLKDRLAPHIKSSMTQEKLSAVQV